PRFSTKPPLFLRVTADMLPPPMGRLAASLTLIALAVALVGTPSAAATSVAARYQLRGHLPELGEKPALRVFQTNAAYDAYRASLGDANVFPAASSMFMSFDKEILALYVRGNDSGGRCFATTTGANLDGDAVGDRYADAHPDPRYGVAGGGRVADARLDVGTGVACGEPFTRRRRGESGIHRRRCRNELLALRNAHRDRGADRDRFDAVALVSAPRALTPAAAPRSRRRGAGSSRLGCRGSADPVARSVASRR